MKKIIGWFKNILMRILEVVNYMVKKDNEIELAKLEVKREIAKDVFRAVSDSKVRKVLGCTALGLGIGISIIGVGLLSIPDNDFNATQNVLAN